MSGRRGAGLAQRLRPWRWTLQAAVLGLAGVLLLALVFASPTERFCSDHGTGCGLVTGFIGTMLVAIGGYFVIVVWALRRAIPQYLDVARRTPERLLPTAGRIGRGDIVARPGLAAAIAGELDPARRGAPVLVVGAAGAGKTTFLLELVSRIAEDRAVPVACSLRGAEPPVRLRAMARERFVEAIDPLVRSADHAERIWRRLCADGEIVVVADGLDELMPGRPSHERDQVIRAALAGARNDRLPVVVASRPETVPVGARVSMFELDPLAEADAVRYLEERIPRRSRPDPAVLRDLASVGSATPYYLDVIAALHRAGRLPSAAARNRDALLVELLDRWVELLVEQRILREVELDRAGRAAIVERLGAVACAMTRDAVLESDVRAIAAEADQRTTADKGRLAAGAVVDGAARLELVETFAHGDGTGVRFTHAISQAYFLSRLLRDEPGAWRELVDGTPSAEMNRALVMWSARDGDRDRAAEVGEALVERAAALDADRALLLLVTAGEVASAVGRDEFGALAGDGAGGAWRGASVRARLAAIRRLERCAGAWSLRALQERTRDENYRVRWAAARAIAASGDAAWDVLGRDFERLVTAGAARRSASWTDRETHDISVAGWILPALAPALQEPGRTAAGRLVERLAGLVPQVPAGTEASLAQGFKLDALTNPAGPVAPAAWELLKRARFWYSRIVLAHAACIRAIGDMRANPDAGRRLAELARHDPHPFAAAAADLCVRALRAGDRARWLWDDEVATITGSGGALDDGAARLLADVVLLLNLTEQGELAGSEAREAQEQRKEDAYRRPGLPHCLAGSRTRDELFDGCPPDRCPFDLCPYPATADRALGRGEFSAAFCRHQGEIAARRASAPARAARRGRRRWTRLSGRDAVRFWERMESRAS